MFEIVNKKLINERRKKKQKILAGIVAFSATAAVLCVAVNTFSNKEIGVDKKADVAFEQTTNEDNIVIEANERIAVCLYAAKTEGQCVDASYEQTMKKTEIREGETVNMGIYNPALSSVPGYPITISYKDTNDDCSNEKINIEVDGGDLVTWDISTGIVNNIGKSGEFDLGDSIYWSALENDRTCSSATITIQYIVQDEVIETRRIRIVEMEDGTYMAEGIG